MESFFNGNNYWFIENNDDPSVFGCISEIIYNNEYCLEKFSNMETTIIDIGANCGVASIILAKQNPKSTILSFEPDTKTYNLLIENIRINSINNIKAYNKAVSLESNKTIRLFLHPNYSGGNTTCSDDNAFNVFNSTNNHVDFIDVLTISFDDIITEHNLFSVGLLKIDCEGAEYEIIYGSNCFKEGIVKNLVGEFHKINYNTKSLNIPHDLFEYCKKYVIGLKKITVLNLTKELTKEIVEVQNLLEGNYE